jgi:hypothetical protein
MSVITLHIKDETATGTVLNELDISFNNSLTTVKEIITKRVIAEVESYNNRLPEYYCGLIQPTDSEKTLNGFKVKQKKKINGDEQVETALKAFERNGYFILIDNIQSESLEQMVVINQDTEISFVKLTPLVGG